MVCPIGNGVYDVPLVSLSARLRSYSSSNDSRRANTFSPGARPVYLDANGRWWDETYTLCRNAPVVPPPAATGTPEAQEAQPQTQDTQLLALIQSNPKPQPSAFASYKDYEAALIKWKDTLEDAILRAEILLPSPQGRFYYRPAFNPHRTSPSRSFPLFLILGPKSHSFCPANIRQKSLWSSIQRRLHQGRILLNLYVLDEAKRLHFPYLREVD